MTLKEWVERLPEIHYARKEYEALLSSPEEARRFTPCEDHKAVTHHLIPGVPEGSSCFGCYMDAVKMEARHSLLSALEVAKGALEYNTERFSDDGGYVNHGALRHKEGEGCLICEAIAAIDKAMGEDKIP
jgi:hypothetical protein